MLEKKDHSLNERQQHIEEMESKVDEMIRMQQSELERISSLTRDEAKQIILDRVENELSHDIAIMTKETENRAKEEADKKGEKHSVACFAALCSRSCCRNDGIGRQSSE